jgi:hypothetical protein
MFGSISNEVSEIENQNILIFVISKKAIDHLINIFLRDLNSQFKKGNINIKQITK